MYSSQWIQSLVSRYIYHLIICIGLAHLLLCDDHEYLFSFIFILHLPSPLISPFVFLLCPCVMFRGRFSLLELGGRSMALYLLQERAFFDLMFQVFTTLNSLWSFLFLPVLDLVSCFLSLFCMDSFVRLFRSAR